MEDGPWLGMTPSLQENALPVQIARLAGVLPAATVSTWPNTLRPHKVHSTGGPEIFGEVGMAGTWPYSDSYTSSGVSTMRQNSASMSSTLGSGPL